LKRKKAISSSRIYVEDSTNEEGRTKEGNREFDGVIIIGQMAGHCVQRGMIADSALWSLQHCNWRFHFTELPGTGKLLVSHHHN